MGTEKIIYQQKENTDSKRPVRMDKGVIRLTERDLVLLEWIGEQYTVRFDTLLKLISKMPDKRSPKEDADEGVSDRNVRRVIKRWQESGLAKYQKFLYHEPGWVWLTNKGLSTVGLDYRLYTPTVASLSHLHLINELRLRLEERYKDGLAWKGERAVRREFEQLPEAQRQARHLPDAEVIVIRDGRDHHIAVEVEVTQKSANRLREIVYRLQGQYSGIWYFVNDVTEPAVKSAIGEYSTAFRVYRISEVLKEATTSA